MCANGMLVKVIERWVVNTAMCGKVQNFLRKRASWLAADLLWQRTHHADRAVHTAEELARAEQQAMGDWQQLRVLEPEEAAEQQTRARRFAGLKLTLGHIGQADLKTSWTCRGQNWLLSEA